MRNCLILCTATLLAAAGGCSTERGLPEGAPPVASAAGKVTYKGAPLAGATVVFIPVAGTHAASATTDDLGHFSLTAFPPHPGAVAGEYRVAITKTETVDVPTDDPDNRVTRARSVIPERYGQAEQSGLTAQIPEGGIESLEFSLN